MIAACERALVISVLLALGAGPAIAQTPSPADAAFKRGRELLKAGKPADACIEFEHSNKLDPQLGTAFNIAQCSEQVGKLARALELYRDLLKRDSNPQRKGVVASAIPRLEARVPRLLVRVAAKPAGLIVTFQPIQSVVPPRPIEVNKPIEMDLGEYTIIARAPSMPDWTGNFRIGEEAKTTTVELPVPGAAKPADATTGTTTPGDTTTGTAAPIDADADADDERAQPGKSNRKLFAVGALTIGGVAVIGGAVFGSLANSKWSAAKDVCGGTTCATQADLDRANKLGDVAASRATLSTVFFVAGGLAAAGGILLWVTAPSQHEVQVSATPTPGGGGFAVSGRF